jgi:ferredoxin
VCPTAAIRPITLEQKLGRGAHAEAGPIRLGTAFVDYGRCLPWAMDKPCIVCQENCPVSPKAIFVREHYSSVRGGVFSARQIDSFTVEVTGTTLRPGQFATGDYYLLPIGDTQAGRRLIAANSEHSLKVAEQHPWETAPAPGATFEIQVRLQRPQVDPELCIGCGVCEHECPVSGKRAIRVTAENESRSRKHALLL